MRRSRCAADVYNRAPTCPGLAPNITLFPAIVNNKITIFHSTCFYEFLCIMKFYSIGIPKSETLSGPSISDNGYQTVAVKLINFFIKYYCKLNCGWS
jgi:hypothetical protein